MLKLSELIRLLKLYVLNPAISDEELLNAFLLPFVIAGDITNKNKEEFHLNKARTSKIMNQKEDVPTKLREALSIYGIRDRTIVEMDGFIEDFINPNKRTLLTEKLMELLPPDNICKDNNALKGNGSLSDVLTDVMMESFAISNLSPPEKLLIWKHGIGSVEIQTGDLFHFGFNNRSKKKNIVVVPVNTSFDTHVTRKFENAPSPLVSENTVHGQWLVRMKESGENVDHLNKRITVSLRSSGFFPDEEGKNVTRKPTCYPVGSIAIIETKNAVYFLVAISQFDEFNNARSSSEDINNAIRSIIEVYDRVGMGYDLYLPLMGTGLSRAGLSLQEAYDLMLEEIIRNGNKIHGHIHMVLRPEDRKEIKIKEAQ